MRTATALVVLLSALAGCKSTYYATMERFGVHKREILVDRVKDGREEQAEAKEQFQTTLEAFQELTGFEGGELEKLYDRVNDEYERSEDRAEAVRERIDKIESVASELFEEWRAEIEEISDASLRARDEKMLAETQRRYDQLLEKMELASERMDPVLRAFKDRVLYLKHNLNALAIDHLRKTDLEIQGDVDALLREMQASIEEADAFVAAMDE